MEDVSVKLEGEQVVITVLKPEFEVAAKVKLVAILEKLAAQTVNEYDDKIVALLKAIAAKV